MTAIYIDSVLNDDERRELLYQGNIIVLAPTSNSLALCDFANELICKAFGDLDPVTAQYHMPVEQYAAILSDLKPKFIHHPKSKQLIQGILKETGCDLSKTYFDVPRMRTSTSDNYLTSGIAYAFHPHRDTWYSAPQCQINWWLPIYEVESGNVMAFHPRYWDQPVQNGSHRYNYQEWNKNSRFLAAQQIQKDTREQPKPEESLELNPDIRVVTGKGGILLFAAAHLHSSLPNTTGKTRFSIDFRTVHLDDVAEETGAPNVDSECSGTTMGDYLRGTDLTNVPEKWVAAYDKRKQLQKQIKG